MEVARANGVPTVSPAELTPEAVRAGIASGGCLMVPGLVPRHLVDRLVDDIDHAIEGYDAHAAGAPVSDTTPWFEPFRPAEQYRTGYKVRAKRERPIRRRRVDDRLAAGPVRPRRHVRRGRADRGDHSLPR